MAKAGKDFRTGEAPGSLPLVTIGVLSYNYEQYVISALDSLLHQTYPFIELIIIDDCSSDNAPALIDAWINKHQLHCTYLKNENNLGITRVSNLLVKMAKGKYINLFATDDIMLPEKIARQVNILEEAGEEYGLCYAKAEKMDEEGHSIPDEEEFAIHEGDVLVSYLKKEFAFSTPVQLIRTSVYKKVGLYDERVLIEDYNFFVRLFSKYKVKYCDYPCLIYRMKIHSPINHAVQKNSQERYCHDRILSIEQALKFTGNLEAKKILLSKMGQYLNNLAMTGSTFFYKMLFFLLSRGHFTIPVRSIKYRIGYLMNK